MPLPSSSWLDRRTSGVLAHVSSLPGPFGIGNLGQGARDFIDFLAEAGFRYWQICPVGPTGYGDSPYQSFSSFAGNPYFLDLSELASAGLLTAAELAPLRRLPGDRIDYGALYEQFLAVLAIAHRRFLDRGLTEICASGPLAEFRATHAAWLESYALFMALKNHHGGRSWTEWAPPFRDGPEAARVAAPREVRDEAERHIFFQYLFAGQWSRLRAHARERGVEIIGDLPIFVALDSSDTWQCREVFRLDPDGQPLAVAGVPPDYFSDRGQRWGNPLYDWDYLKQTGYGWWMERLGRAFDLFDVVRLDHFRGFDTYWEIPAEAADARTGQWRQGPGSDFFAVLNRRLPAARIIAEDLGYITAEVVDLRREAGLPGMKILQFAYGHDDNNVNLPHFFHADAVVYTGTHDNNTARGWLESLTPEVAARVEAYYQIGDQPSAWPLIRAAMASVARLAVVPLQDLLDLDASARMNRPGTAEGNWQWRVSTAQLEDLRRDALDTLRAWHRLFDREGDTRQHEYSAPPAPTA